VLFLWVPFGAHFVERGVYGKGLFAMRFRGSGLGRFAEARSSCSSAVLPPGAGDELAGLLDAAATGLAGAAQLCVQGTAGDRAEVSRKEDG
jgi:hypothetical protein